MQLYQIVGFDSIYHNAAIGSLDGCQKCESNQSIKCNNRRTFIPFFSTFFPHSFLQFFVLTFGRSPYNPLLHHKYTIHVYTQVYTFFSNLLSSFFLSISKSFWVSLFKTHYIYFFFLAKTAAYKSTCARQKKSLKNLGCFPFCFKFLQ